MSNKINCTVVNKNDDFIVFKGKRIDNVYKINFSELVDQKVVCLLSHLSVNDKKWLWQVIYNLSEAYQTLTIIQMHFVVHARRGRL